MRVGIQHPRRSRSIRIARPFCLAATLTLAWFSTAWAGSEDSTLFRDGMEEYLALRGRASIEDSPLVNASVRARWGSRMETTTANIDGEYSLLLTDLAEFDAPLEITA